MKKPIYIIVAVIIIIIAVVAFLRFVVGGPEDDWICVDGEWVMHGAPSAPKPSSGCGAAINSFDDCVAAGNPVMEIYPEQCRTADGKTFTQDIGNELEKIDLIQLDNPRPNATITSPLEISGRARGTWFFEGDFPVRLTDENGAELGRAVAQAQSEWMTEEFVAFDTLLEFSVPASDQGILILEKNNPSGLATNDDQLIIPVKFDLTDTTKIKVYFNNTQLNPQADCNEVFPVEREIWTTKAVAQAALKELLKGTTAEEKAKGFETSLPLGVELQSLTIENGITKVDFNDQLEFQVGGSCRVAAISAQISETLKQFPTVESVVISIDGRTEDILQP